MNRRRFLKDTTLGALALGLPTGAFARNQSILTGTTVVRALARACGAREWPGLAFRLAAPLLNAGVNRDLARYAREQFETGHYQVFTLRGGNLVFLELEKRLAGTNLVEYAVPFWGRGADGRYRHLVTLNGFQVEALLRAAGQLRAQAYDASAIGRLLLPAGPAAGPAGFLTSNGRVALRTVLESGAVMTTIEVIDNGNFAYRDRFAAAHLQA